MTPLLCHQHLDQEATSLELGIRSYPSPLLGDAVMIHKDSKNDLMKHAIGEVVSSIDDSL